MERLKISCNSSRKHLLCVRVGACGIQTIVYIVSFYTSIMKELRQTWQTICMYPQLRILTSNSFSNDKWQGVFLILSAFFLTWSDPNVDGAVVRTPRERLTSEWTAVNYASGLKTKISLNPRFVLIISESFVFEPSPLLTVISDNVKMLNIGTKLID